MAFKRKEMLKIKEEKKEKRIRVEKNKKWT